MSPKALRAAVVDDDRAMLSFVSDVLSSAGGAGGIEVVGFRSGEEALAALWDAPVDVLVVDLLLPRMTGVELVKELRRRPWARSLPVAAISALQWTPERAAELTVAMNPCRLMPKPVDMDELLDFVSFVPRGADTPPPIAEAAISASDEPSGPHVLEVALLNPRDLLREFTENLSKDGLFISTWDPLPKDAEVKVRLSFPFRREVVEVDGTVVGSIAAHEPAARTHGPGMAIWLQPIPKDVKRELAAYIAGLRALAPYTPAPKARRLLVVGMEASLQHSFFSRSDVRVVQLRELDEAIAQLRRHGPASVVIDGGLIGSGGVGELRHAGAEWIAVRGDDDQLHNLGGAAVEVELLHSSLSAAELVDALSARFDGFVRAAARVSLTTPVIGARSDSGLLRGTLQNVSLGGVLLVTDAPCAPGDRIDLEFKLPDGSGLVRAMGSAIRVSRAGADRSEVSVALTFDRVEPDSLDALRAFLESRAGPAAYQRLISTPAINGAAAQPA